MYKRFTKILIEIVIVLLFCLSFTISSFAKISIIQLTEDNNYTGWTNVYFQYDIWKSQINDSGKVVWIGWDGNNTEIYFYDGRYTNQLTDNAYPKGNLRINNRGELVWVEIIGSDSEIIFYDGTTISQLTDNDYDDWSPQINDNGQVVWSRWDGNDSEIFFYDGTTITQLTDNEYNDGPPQINNNGEVVWNGDYFEDDDEIFFYNGTTVIQLTDNDYNDQFPHINNSGQLVWVSWRDDWGYLIDDEIFFYDGTTITQLTDNDYDDSSPQINDIGEVVWSGYPRGNKSQIFLYDGTTITRLPDNKSTGGPPQINNNGEVVWAAGFSNNLEIWFYDGTTTTRLTNNKRIDGAPQINNSGEVTWYGYKYHKPGCNTWCLGSADDYAVYLAIDEYRSMVVIEPNGGEILFSGSTYTINWDAPAKAVEFGLSYSTNRGKSWKHIDYVKDLTYDWIVPSPPQNMGKCLIKVTGFDITGEKVGEDKSDAPFTIEVISIKAPNGGEAIASGSNYNISWDTNGTEKPVDHVKIFCSTKGGKKWELMATELGNPGNSNCVFPIAKKNMANCLVKVLAYDATDKKVAEDQSDGPFTIEVVKVISPNGGEGLSSGNVVSIDWNTHQTIKEVAKVVLKYSIKEGKKWKTIETIEGNNPGTYSWTVPNFPEAKDRCKVMVQLKDKKGKSVGSDTSDSYFTVEP